MRAPTEEEEVVAAAPSPAAERWVAPPRRNLRVRWTESEYRQSGLRLAALGIMTVPIFVGFLWLFIASFSDRSHGLMPVDAAGNFGGLTFEKWRGILQDPQIWQLTFNTFVFSVGLTVVVVLISALAGYALSRLKFRGRRAFLGTTLIFHAFPAVTLLISIFIVLRWLRDVPIVGRDLPVVDGIGYNTMGGVILVSVAFLLPLGVWLMKGFFDGVPWDIERAALVDGCSRVRAWWNVVLPQVRPGIAALSIFSFIMGWGMFIIPYTFILQFQDSVINAYLFQRIGESARTDWGEVAAIGLFQLIPVMIFFTFTQRYLLKIFGGGTRGGV